MPSFADALNRIGFFLGSDEIGVRRKVLLTPISSDPDFTY
jgi:hypothetical protein